MSSRGRHSQGLLVAVSSGEMWITSQHISEVDHPGFDDRLSVRVKEQTGARNDS